MPRRSEPPARRGCLLFTLVKLVTIGVILISVLLIGVIATIVIPDRGSTEAPGPTPPASVVRETPPPPITPSAGTIVTPERAAPTPVGLQVGSLVEVTGRVLADSRSVFDERRAAGGKRQNQLGKEIFGVAPGASARVREVDGDAVRIEMLGGSWKGRLGWISADGLRIPPDKEESSRNVADGLTLDRRREIYGAYYLAGMRASREADSRYPLGNMPSNPGQAKGYMARHTALYDSRKAAGRREIIKKYKIDGATLDRIDTEGAEEKWPLPEVP